MYRNAKMSRHDIPDEVKNVINVAIETSTIDILDVYTLADTYGNNWRKMIDEIIEYAFVDRHSRPEKHTKVVEAAEAYWMTQPIS